MTLRPIPSATEQRTRVRDFREILEPGDSAASEQRTAEHAKQFDRAHDVAGSDAPDDANALIENDLMVRMPQPHRFQSEPT